MTDIETTLYEALAALCSATGDEDWLESESIMDAGIQALYAYEKALAAETDETGEPSEKLHGRHDDG